MRRARDSRLLRALVGLWFAVALSEPAALHACAMHGAGHHASAVAGHGHAAGPHASRHAPVPHPQHAACSCLGSCCAAAAAVVPVAAVVPTTRAPARPAGAMSHRAIRFRLAEPAYARPPSHAPPLAPA